MNYEYLTMEDAEKLAKKELSEQIAVEYLNQLTERKILTDMETMLSNSLIERTNTIAEIVKSIEVNKSLYDDMIPIEYIEKIIEGDK